MKTKETEDEQGDAAQRFRIYPAESPSEIELIRELFLEYANSLGFSLCFQGFDQELAGLPGDYAPPEGRLLLAEYDGKVAGCGALHRVQSSESGVAGNVRETKTGTGRGEPVAEMKRFYLRPEFRGKGLGRALAERILQEARNIGYARLRLDTVEPVMKDAVAMYRRMGFREIEAYRVNPMAGTLYMELDLR